MDPYVGIQDITSECDCLSPVDEHSALNLLNFLLNSSLNPENISCLFNTIFSCCNVIDLNNLTYQNPIRLAFTDIFYRIRHEILFKSVMLYLGLNQTVSDMKFSEFGISSDRTPDYIGYHSDYLLILEITATSKFEKGAQQKGLEIAGFESKYKTEIDEFNLLGKKVCYIPIIFEMSSSSGEEYLAGLAEATQMIINDNPKNKSIVSFVAKEFKLLTLNIKDSLTAPSSILFSKNVKIERNHPNLEFLYTEDNELEDAVDYEEYEEQKISSKVYIKVINSWDSLGFKVRRLSARFDDDNTKFCMVVDMVTNRILFEQRKTGLSLIDWEKVINLNLKREAFSNTLIKLGEEYKRCNDSETGYTYIVKKNNSKKSSREKSLNNLDISSKGHTFREWKENLFDLSKYEEISENYKDRPITPKFYKKGYEDLYFKFINDLDNYCLDETEQNYNFNDAPTFIGENKVKQYKINEIMASMKNNYLNCNDMNSGLPLKKKKVKSPFILPFACLNQTNYTSHKYKNVNFIQGIKKEILDSNPFTSIILDKCTSDDYLFGEESRQPSSYLNSKIQEKSKLSSEMTSTYKKLLKDFNSNLPQEERVSSLKFENLPDSEGKNCYNELISKIRKVSKEVEEQYKLEKIKRNISTIRLKTKPIKRTREKPHLNENFLTSLYKREMEHFKDRTVQSTIEGVGIIQNIENDYKKGKEDFSEVMGLLSINCGYNPDQIIDLKTYDDCKLLKECKEYSLKRYQTLITQVKDSFLGHSATLVSRMAHSLLFYSQLPFSSDYIRVDNLGYKDVLLIVKGGKKIFRTKSSKLYRMIYPIHPCLSKLYVNNSVGPSSYQIVHLDNKVYLVTPWMLLHESILNDSLSFYSRTTSFVILNSNPEIDYSEQSRKTAMNVLLAFHNRRQTETLLANIRYILLSTIGEYSAFSGILQEFVGFNYDFFQSFIRNSIVLNYEQYFREICSVDPKKPEGKELKLTNIFTCEKMSDVDELALMIYSTFLMTKAPYQRAVERANNLKGILDIHRDFKSHIGLDFDAESQLNKLKVNVEDGSLNYVNSLFKNDYMIDPYFITQIGVFADSYFKARGLKEEIFVRWNRVLTENWDSMATSTGLRSRIEDKENFWGKKGYFVVYSEIQSDSSYMLEVQDMLQNEKLTDDQKRKKLRNLNQTFYDKIRNPSKMLIFHAVDKTQWRGGREIYVMDIETKIEQQPIEKFMGSLCKMVDNELISIPSDRRAQTIHHSIFEKDLPLKDALTYYMTLDCSKWAPKSIFIKFALMILPMKTIPYSFKVHFLNYLSKLYFKRIYFNNSEVEVLRKNPKYKLNVDENLKFDDTVKGYYLEMPYSWVMGIFNYTSSFLHAMNQKYMSYLITQSSISKFNEETTLVMFAHSDDSGGRISSTREVLIQRGLIIYEIGLKACNHSLSRKKCTVSLVYFEILSIIYLFKKLLALLPKFLGGIRFLPTDKGMAQDMLQSYSKSIEIMVAGGDFTIAYLTMKMHSYLVWKFYMSHPPGVIDYERPVQYLGMPDSHPLIVLLAGSDSDIIRILNTKGDDYLAKLSSYIKHVFDTFNEEGAIRSIKFQIKIRNSVKGFEVSSENFNDFLSSWTVKNVNFRTTPFAMLNFLSKLNDPGFVGSLLNESPIRRISRSYFLRIGQSVMTRFGPKTLKFTYDAISSFQLYLDGEIAISKILEGCLGEDTVNQFHKEVDELVLKNKSNLQVTKMSCFNIMKIYEYFDQITLEGKTFLKTNRTLKPTHLEIVKTNKAFSVDFSPSQLVSYCKNPKFRWALPDVGNLMVAELELKKLLEVHEINMDEVDESSLMKLLTMFSGKSVKDIYLYSHVPSEIRTMRTYSSLLSFLSVNTQKGREISGLVLKLKSDLTDPGYLPLQIDENIYIINTIMVGLIVLSKLLGWEFLNKLTIKGSKFLQWEEGKLMDFLNHIRKSLNENYMLPYLSPTINYIQEKLNWPKRSPTGSIFDRGAYYTFTKSQKSNDGWYGKGEILIVIEFLFFKFEVLNESIVKCYTNQSGKLSKVTFDYIIDVLTSNDIYISQRDMKDPGQIKTEISFGFDHSGDLKVSYKKEVKKGIECVLQTTLIGDHSHLSHFFVEHRDDNNYILTKRGTVDTFGSIKIKTAKILKGEILNTMRAFLKHEDFKVKMDEVGINDFDDFLLTEVLTEFGGENYIGTTEFLDNFQSSRLYKLMEWGQSNCDQPNNIDYFGKIPGSIGGLAHLFICSGEQNNDWVIKPPKKINRAIMNLRSEYPESFTLILNEKLNEFFNDIYNVEERQEIRKSYIDLVTAKSQGEVRTHLIKLMCYWGYSSLVHTVQCFNNLKVVNNYSMFKITGYNLQEQGIYSSVFEGMMLQMNKTILNYTHMSKSLNFRFQRLFTFPGGMESIVANNCKGISNSLFAAQVYLTNAEIYSLRFLNLIDALFDIPEFTEDLQESFQDLYPLSMLPIDIENKVNFIVTYNTLKIIWSKVNKVDFALDFKKMVQRMPSSSPTPYNIAKRLTNTLSPADTYFHGALDREYLTKMSTPINFHYKGIDYNIKNEITELSKINVPIMDCIQLILPLNEQTLENPEWEDIVYESEMVSLDTETIIDLWGEIEDPFVEQTSIIENDYVEIELKWVIEMYKENSIINDQFVRQVGEAVCVLTTSIHNNLLKIPNTYSRLITLKPLGKHCTEFIVYCILPPGVSEDFVDRFLGKNKPPVYPTMYKDLSIDLVRTPEGVCRSCDMGVAFENIFDEKPVEQDEGSSSNSMLWGQLEVEDEDLKGLYKKQEIDKVKEEVKEIINDAVESNPQCSDMYEQMYIKYSKQLDKGFTLSNKMLMASLIAELDLNELNETVKNNLGDIATKEETIRMFTSPVHFGLAHQKGAERTVNFKDKKIKAELESLEQTLADKIGSGTLTISSKYREIMKSNLMIWKSYVSTTSHKQESKKFLWNLLRSICIDATPAKTDTDDHIWRNIVEKSVNYIAEEGQAPNNIGEKFKLTLKQGSRMKYRHKGN